MEKIVGANSRYMSDFLYHIAQCILIAYQKRIMCNRQKPNHVVFELFCADVILPYSNETDMPAFFRFIELLLSFKTPP